MRNVLGPMDRDEWLEKRLHFVTATEAVSLFPLKSKYKTREALLDKKLGRDKPFVSNRYTVFGSLAEGFLCDAAETLLRVRTRLCQYPVPGSAGMMVTNSDYPALSATPDALVRIPDSWGEDGFSEDFSLFRHHGSAKLHKSLKDALTAREGQTGLLELKTTHSERAYKVWKEAPPEDYWVQVQVQLAVCEYDWALLFGYTPGPNFICHFIEKDESFLTDLKERVSLFWKEVEDAKNAKP